MELKTFTVSMSNGEMKNHIAELQAVLSQRNILGYLAAYNTRVLSNALQEYSSFEQEAVLKYGIDVLDSDGRKTGAKTIEFGSENYDKFIAEMSPYLDIIQTVSIAKADVNDAVGILSGEEFLSLEWMLDGGGVSWPE